MEALRETPELARPLPRGRHAARREVVWESQRGRLLSAMAAAAAELGYAEVAVADVIERAGVSRKTFYEHFANREACFLAAYDAGVEVTLTAIDEAIGAAAPDWEAAIEAGVRRYLETLAGNPDFARMALLEVFGAGPAARERRVAVHDRFAGQIAQANRAARQDRPELPVVPEWAFRACVGAVDELATDQLLRRGPERLPELAGPIVDLYLALFTGRRLGEPGEAS